MIIKNLTFGTNKNAVFGENKNAVAGYFYSVTLTGTAKVSAQHDLTLLGAAQTATDKAITLLGASRTLRPTSVTLLGAAKVHQGHTATLLGATKVNSGFLHSLLGLSRVANDALARYELYVGDGVAPAEDATPVATGTASVTAPALDPAGAGETRDYYFVLRRRNRWGLVSGNTWSNDDTDAASWCLTVDDTGAAVTISPTAPIQVTAEPAPAGAVKLFALYAYTQDGDNAADTWLVYTTTDGTDPDPATDTPVTVSMILAGAHVQLDYTTAAQVDGVEVRAVIATRRSGEGGADSPGSGIVSAIADTDGPDAPAGAVFFGTTAAKQGS